MKLSLAVANLASLACRKSVMHSHKSHYIDLLLSQKTKLLATAIESWSSKQL